MAIRVDTSSPSSAGSRTPDSPSPKGGLDEKQPTHRRHLTLDRVASHALAISQIPVVGVDIDAAIDNLCQHNESAIKPCPLRDFNDAFKELRKKYSEEPPCCGCCDPWGLFNASLEGAVTYFTAPLGPAGAAIFSAGRSRLESWWENSNISEKAKSISDLGAEFQALCSKLQEDYETVGKALQTRYLNAKHGFGRDSETKEDVIAIIRNLYANLDRISKVINNKLGILKRDINIIDGKKIISPLKETLEIILKDASHFQGQVNPEKNQQFTMADSTLAKRKAYHESQKKALTDLSIELQRQAKEIEELRGIVIQLKPTTPTMDRGPSAAVLAAGAPAVPPISFNSLSPTGFTPRPTYSSPSATANLAPPSPNSSSQTTPRDLGNAKASPVSSAASVKSNTSSPLRKRIAPATKPKDTRPPWR